MNIGIIAPFNPACIARYLYGKDIPSINNNATAVNTLVVEFLRQGHTVKIFTLTPKAPHKYETFKGKNVCVYLVPTGLFPRLCGYRQFKLWQFYLPQRLARIVHKELNDLDVLHAHWTYEYAKAASLLSDEKKVFVTVRDWCPYQLGIMRGMKKIAWFLKYITFKQVMTDDKITFVANSNYTYEKIVDAYPEKIIPIIPNPIDKSWILDKKKKQVSYNVISIAQGLNSARKNIGKLLEAFCEYRKLFSNAQLHLVGRYDKHSDMYINWKNNGWLEGVIFHGTMPHEELSALLDEMSFMVHPAWEETFGNILLEAMSRCVPCIGGEKSGAVPVVLGNGQYGLICDINNSKSILDAMIKMNDEKLSTAIQNRATTMIKSTYSSEIIANRHIGLYMGKLDQHVL